MKIGTNLFEPIDEEATKKQILKALDSESTYLNVAIVYEELVYAFAGKRIWFLPPKASEAIKEKKMKQLRMFVEIAVEVGVPFEVYMKAQFEQLVPYLKKVNPKMPYPAFSYLLTEKAVDRFFEYRKRMKDSYIGRDRWTVEFYRTSYVDVVSSVRSSAQKFHNQLVKLKAALGTITPERALQELEVMARAGFVSNIYVYGSPIVEGSESEYLVNLQAEAGGKLNEEQKEAVKRVRKNLRLENTDEDVLGYV